MALFGFLKADSTKRQEFTDDVIKGLVQAGQARPWKYGVEQFSLSSASAVFNLAHTYEQSGEPSPNANPST